MRKNKATISQNSGILDPTEYFETMKRWIDTAKLTELHYVNEFTLTVAVILSAQATDKKVNEVTPKLFSIADTPEKMLALGENGLKEHIKVISFFNNKARNIIALSKLLAGEADAFSDGNWAFPEKYHNPDELVKLPGIGQKTANVVSNVLWRAPLIGVDTHVFRLAHRFGWADDSDNTPEKVEKKLVALIPKKYHSIANHVMVMHGRYFCKALRPDCENCPLKSICKCRMCSVE